MKHYLGIDIGGTNVKGIICNELGKKIAEVRAKTESNLDGDWRQNVLETYKKLLNKVTVKIEAVGLSAPGLANIENTCIAHLPGRLPGLENFSWGGYFEKQTYVVNDAHAAAMAEKLFGEGKDFKDFILLTLGTGVGGGIVVNNKLVQGQSQMAGHLGHTLVNESDSEQSILGMYGSLEFAIGNYSVSKRSNGRFSSTLELLNAYEEGNHFATYVWLSSVRKLSLALVSLINMLSPQAIILAGGITNAGRLLYDPLNSFLDTYEFRPAGKKTEIVQAKFGDLAGAFGAAAFAIEMDKNKIT